MREIEPSRCQQTLIKRRVLKEKGKEINIGKRFIQEDLEILSEVIDEDTVECGQHIPFLPPRKMPGENSF